MFSKALPDNLRILNFLNSSDMDTAVLIDILAKNHSITEMNIADCRRVNLQELKTYGDNCDRNITIGVFEEKEKLE